jgi:hypothetical protein
MYAPPTNPRRPLLAVLVLVLVLGVAGQALLAFNPGYFSHDELQWGAAAEVASWRDLPWMGWLDVATFQWRPLTFNLWLLISHRLFEAPVAWHLLWVLAGTSLAAALGALLRRLGATATTATVAAVVFALNPYAVYVHGWVATLADLLWVGFALALAHGLLTAHRRAWPGLAVAGLAAALTGLGLLAKEAMVVVPALLALAWLGSGRPRALAWAFAGSSLVVAVYLALRLGVLVPAGPRAAYGMSLAVVPGNLAAFALFPLRPSSFEVQGVLPMSAGALVASAALWVALLLAMRRRSPGLALMLVLGAILALAPVLALENIANQYGYGASAWVVACVALAWPALRRPGKVLVAFLAFLLVWHGVNVQREMRAVGERQAVFQPALVQALRTHGGVLKLYPDAKYAWAYRRLVADVPAWRGEAIGDRVAIVAELEGADFVIVEDGSLRRVEGDRD